MDNLSLPALRRANTRSSSKFSALVPAEDLAGLPSNAPSTDWPPAKRRWTRSAETVLVVYPRGAVIVTQTQDLRLDPVAAGGLSVRRVIIRPKGEQAEAVVIFDINEKLPVSVSFDVALRAGGQTVTLGSPLWAGKRPNGQFGPNSPNQLTADIKPLAPDVRQADVILTPNPKPVEEVAGIDRIWGKKVVFEGVPLTRQDSPEADKTPPNAKDLSFGPMMYREITRENCDAEGLVFFSIETGKTLKPPFPLKYHIQHPSIVEFTPELKKWIAANRVDVLFHVGEKDWDHVALEMVGNYVGQPAEWESLQPERVVQYFSKYDADGMVSGYPVGSSTGDYRSGWGLVAPFAPATARWASSRRKVSSTRRPAA